MYVTLKHEQEERTVQTMSIPGGSIQVADIVMLIVQPRTVNDNLETSHRGAHGTFSFRVSVDEASGRSGFDGCCWNYGTTRVPDTKVNSGAALNLLGPTPHGRD